MSKQERMSNTPTTQTQTLNVKGTQVYVATRSGDDSGPALLLMNGLGANLELFDPFLDALDSVRGQKIRTICFDIPGVGGSPLPRFPLRFPCLACLIAQMLDVLGYQEVDVLGISWGGALAQQFAHQYPWRCRRLILVSTSTGAISVPGRLDVLTKLLSPRRYFKPSYMETIAPILYGGGFRENPDLARAYAQLIRAPHSLGYYGQLLAGLGWTSLPWLHRVRQPTLVLAGKDDAIVPSINAKIMARLIPNATLQVLRGGHLFLLSEKEQVASLVHTFLRTQTS
jgi:poly(3-hydroxyalkanoate) depolymerase